MFPRGAYAVLCAGLVAAAFVSCARPARRSPQEFSLVLVTLDTTRADKIGAFGGTAVPTPHLDEVARQGFTFSTAITQVPLTLPSHCSILTGRYPASHGVRHNGLYRLPESEETLAEHLSLAGFDTAGFVGAFVLNHGFGTNQGFKTYGDIDTFRYQGGRDNLYDSRRSAADVNRAVFEWLDHKPKGRFFLWVHYYDAHHPYNCQDVPGRALSGAGYDRCISYLDAAFGDLTDRLGKDGLLDNVLLVVAGDHGESLGEHREQTHGIFLYQGAVRVPLFIRAPGLVPEGKAFDEPVELVDIAPTVLDLLGAPALPRAEGKSLAPMIEGRRGAPGVAFAETLMPRIEFGWSELRMVQDRRYRYIQAPAPELYDLREDPKEEHNLAASDSARAAEMAGTLSSWVARTKNPDAEKLAQRELSADEEARLRSLGYLGSRSDRAESNVALPDPKDRIDEGLMIYQARENLDAGRNEEALDVADQILGRSPQNYLARSTKIEALIRLKRLDEAEAEAIAGVDFAAHDPVDSATLLERARRTLASIYWMKGKNSKAEEQYRMAIELNKGNAHSAAFGGLLLGAAGGVEDAMRIVDQALERNPKDGLALAARFELELSRNEREKAFGTAKSLADLKAGDWDTLFKAGKLARDFKDPRLAARLFQLASERNKDDPDVLGYLGTSLLASGDLPGAERALLAARRLRPKDPRGAFYLESLALLQNDEAKARAFMRECLELAPEFSSAELNLARWLGDQRRFPEAEDVVRDVLRRHPDDQEARSLRAQINSLAAKDLGPR